MAANNAGGRQGNNQMNEHVEFSVKAEEDLYLSGTENTIRRVTAETNYSCLMLKTQRFSSLFRHYAKYHGLRKDDLEYYFVNLLENEDTPESVQLQRGDTIMVRKRRKPEPKQVAADDDEFFKDLKELLDDEEHMDALFLVYPDYLQSKRSSISGSTSGNSNKAPASVTFAAAALLRNNSSPVIGASNDSDMIVSAEPDYIEIRAHKCMLTARGDYFKALFRTNASARNSNARASVKVAGTSFRESEECVVKVEPYFTEQHIRNVLEFIYTNRIQGLRDISTDELLGLLHLSDKWLLRDLKRLVEHELIREHLTVQNVARLYGATEEYGAKRLSNACIEFIMSNLRQLAGNNAFEEEMKNYPHLCIPVLKAAADLIPDGPVHKKQRTDHAASAGAHTSQGTPSSGAGGALGNSPAVPDSDP